MKFHRGICITAALIIIATLACSLGSDDASQGTSSTISAETGGTITSQDGALTLEIPPGALGEDTEIQILAVSAEDLPSELAELQGVDGGYLLQPDGLTFSDPVAVSWETDLEQLENDGQGGYMATALVSWGEETGLEPLENLATDVSIGEGTAVVSGTLDHFSYIVREDAALLVALEDLNFEQLTGTTFEATIAIDIAVRMHGVLLTDIGGNFIATGDLSVARNPDFEIAYTIGQHSYGEDVYGMYRCSSDPGSGSYGATVHALVTWEAGRSSADRVLQVTVRDVVRCVTEYTPTEVPPRTGESDIGEILIEMGYSADQVNTLEETRQGDNRLDWLYSIAHLPAGLRQDYLDLLWAEGFITDAEYEDVEEWFNDSIFPCGDLVSGRLTVCGMTAGDFPEGDMLTFAAGFDGIIPLEDPEHHYVYALVLDGDGDPTNNFQYMEPYNWDYYQGTDQWYELGWNPQSGDWILTLRLVRGSQPLEQHTEARAVIAGEMIIFFVPASEVAVEMPSYRITSFGHDGTYMPEVSGGDVTGADPTEPLIPLEVRLD